MAYTIYSGLPENITYTMQIPYCGDCFDWNGWLTFGVLVASWLVLLWFAEKRKDVVIAVISVFFALALFMNSIAAATFVIDEYPIVIIFALISIYEVIIITIKK